MFFPPHYLYFLILSLYNSNDTIFPLSVSYNALHVQQIKDKLSLGHWYIPVLWKVPDYSQYIISKHLWKDGSDSGCRENPDSLDIDVFLILQDGNPLFEVYLSNNYRAFRKRGLCLIWVSDCKHISCAQNGFAHTLCLVLPALDSTDLSWLFKWVLSYSSEMFKSVPETFTQKLY